MRYQVRCIDGESGAVREQLLDADSEQVLRDLLRGQGATLLSFRRVRSKSTGPSKAARQARRQFPIFCREVRTLIMAGMTVVEAVDTLSAKEHIAGRDQGISAALLARLHQGQSLSTALEGLPGTPPVLIAAVRAGERTSNLTEALDDYLRFDTLMAQLRRKVVSASIYPAILLLVGSLPFFVGLAVVMPVLGHATWHLYRKVVAR